MTTFDGLPGVTGEGWGKRKDGGRGMMGKEEGRMGEEEGRMEVEEKIYPTVSKRRKDGGGRNEIS